MPSLQELIDSVRSDVDESVASYWTDVELVRWINRGKGLLWQKAVECDEDYGLTSYDFSIVADTDVYALQSNVYRVRRIERIFPNDSSRTPIPWYPITLNEKGDYGVSSASATTDASYRYILEANRLRAFPIPNTAAAGTNNGRIWYVPSLGGLHSATASAGAASTITFPATATQPSTSNGVSRIDDYYIGLDILITGGTGVGQIRRISDYVGSTRVATVGTAWTTNPDSTSTYSLMIPVPDDYQYIASLYASVRAYVKDEADKTQIKDELKDLMGQFIQSITTRQNQEPRYVHYATDERFVF